MWLKIRVLVAGDHMMVRQGLCGLITTNDDVIVGEDSGHGAVRISCRATADLFCRKKGKSDMSKAT